MAIDRNRAKDLINIIRKRFPDWNNFSHPKFMEEEIYYKRNASKKAKELLSKREIKNLVVEKKFDEITERVKKVGTLTNLLWIQIPSKGDLNIILRNDLNKESFCREFFILIHGDKPISERFEKYISFLKKKNLPNKWTFPTYYLFLIYPENEYFVKPKATKWFLRFFDLGHTWKKEPDPLVYSRIKEAIRSLKQELNQYGPRDMIDIQGLIWQCYKIDQNVRPSISTQNDKVLGMLKRIDLNVFKNEFGFFRNTKEYEDRKNQSRFIEVAHMTLEELLKKDHISNSDLTSIIQMFGSHCSPETFLKHLKNLKFKENIEKAIYDRFVEIGEFGYTGRGRAAVKNLNEKQLEAVRLFLKEVLNAENKEKIKEAYSIYKKESIPLVTEGIFSPWLYYLKPGVCPLIAGPVRKFLFKIGWRRDYADAIDFFEILKNKGGEEDLGFIDAFLWKEERSDRIIIQKEEKKLRSELQLLESKKQVILFGPPGTGKTYSTKSLTIELLDLISKMKLKEIFGVDNSPSPREDFPGKSNKWEIIRGKDLKLVSSYPGFYEDLESALKELESNNPISKTVCTNILEEVKKGILTYKTYARFSKWCDWNQKSSETLARNVSRILFGFDMPRLWDQQNREKNHKTTEEFLKGVTNRKEPIMEEKDKEFKAESITEKKKDINQKEIFEKFEKYHEEGRVEFVTFHPSYSYEEFIEGITVEIEEENTASSEMRYILRPGIFKNLCKRALGAALGMDKEEIVQKSWREVFDEFWNSDFVDFKNAPKFVLIIDEINRGNIAKIFGELITLLEADKRLGAENQLIATLPASGDKFGVPGNIYIIATMNTADRSIALLDVALRRRFGFIEMNPNFKILDEEHLNRNRKELVKNKVFDALDKSKEAIIKINNVICEDAAIGRDKQIGHSYLFNVWKPADLAIAWKHEILPLLEEYCYGDYAKINRILFDKESDTEWITKSEGIKDITPENLDSFLNEILSIKDVN